MCLYFMEDDEPQRYALSESLFDKKHIKIMDTADKDKETHEQNTITLLLMGHGRERYKENFKKMNKDHYSEYVNKKVADNKSIRIFSKAGKPKICAWDYSLCTKTMSSQDVLLHLSHLFFSDEHTQHDTLTLMKSVSNYFKHIYPVIIRKISKNYRDHPEDKNSGSPDAEGYAQRHADFQKVLHSLSENKYADLKTLRHEKIFTIRPNRKEEYTLHCEKYWFEIVDLRLEEPCFQTDFIITHLNHRENLVKNYYEMSEYELQTYMSTYIHTCQSIYSLPVYDYDKYYLIKFIFKLYFGHELLLTEIIEFFTILGIQTINILDNTCRVDDRVGLEHTTSPNTFEIEQEEQLLSSSRTRSNNKHSKSNSKNGGKKTRKKSTRFV